MYHYAELEVAMHSLPDEPALALKRSWAKRGKKRNSREDNMRIPMRRLRKTRHMQRPVCNVGLARQAEPKASI